MGRPKSLYIGQRYGDCNPSTHKDRKDFPISKIVKYLIDEFARLDALELCHLENLLFGLSQDGDGHLDSLFGRCYGLAPGSRPCTSPSVVSHHCVFYGYGGDCSPPVDYSAKVCVLTIWYLNSCPSPISQKKKPE